MFALWIAVTRLGFVPARVVEGEAGDARRGVLRDDLQRLDDAGHDLVLEAAVEVLGVLADDDEVHVLETALDRRQVLDGPQVRVEVERLAQAHVDRGEALADRGPDGSLQGHAVLADGVQNARRQGVALEPLGLPADDDLFERERRPHRVEDREHRVGHLRPDAVPPDERDRARAHVFFSGGRIIFTFLTDVGVASSITKSALRPFHRSPLRGIRPKRSIRCPAIVSASSRGRLRPNCSSRSSRRKLPSRRYSRSPAATKPGRLLFVELVLDRPEHLLDRVLDRHDAGRSAELVHDDRHVGAPPAHLPEEILGPLELGHEERLVDVLIEPEALLLFVGQREEVLDVEDPDDVVERPAIDREARELVLLQDEAQVLVPRRLRQGDHLRARRHDVPGGLVAELQDLVEEPASPRRG